MIMTLKMPIQQESGIHTFIAIKLLSYLYTHTHTLIITKSTGDVKRSRAKKGRVETCHKCNRRQASARVKVDNLQVTMCKECALESMQNFNTKRTSTIGV
jgi:hypothetical protein